MTNSHKNLRGSEIKLGKGSGIQKKGAARFKSNLIGGQVDLFFSPGRIIHELFAGVSIHSSHVNSIQIGQIQIVLAILPEKKGGTTVRISTGKMPQMSDNASNSSHDLFTVS